MPSTIQDVMTTELVTCPGTATIADAARLMRDRNIGDVLVTSAGGQLTGIVTLGDLAIVRDPNSALGAISASAPTPQ